MQALGDIAAADSYLIWSQKDELDFRVGEPSTQKW